MKKTQRNTTSRRKLVVHSETIATLRTIPSEDLHNARIAGGSGPLCRTPTTSNDCGDPT